MTFLPFTRDELDRLEAAARWDKQEGYLSNVEPNELLALLAISRQHAETMEALERFANKRADGPCWCHMAGLMASTGHTTQCNAWRAVLAAARPRCTCTANCPIHGAARPPDTQKEGT